MRQPLADADYAGNGIQQPKEQDEGNYLFDLNVPPIPGQAGFDWFLDRWSLEVDGCAPDDPNPDGDEEIGIDFPYPTPVFYVECP